MRLRPFFAALALTAATGAALAHHPGSHAVREKDGRVRLDVAATAPETCAAVATIRNVTPPRVASPPGGAPVTVQLSRKPGACSPAPTLVRHEGFLDIAEGVRLLHLYVVGADGAVLATERVPLR